MNKILLLLLILCTFSCIEKNKNTAFERPNLIFVFTDQHRKQGIGFMNEDPVITPHLDKFASESMVFTNAISSTPICSPYRAMLMTGKYPLTTRVTSNCMPGTDLELESSELCIGDILKENGYRTGYIGKWHLDIPSLNRSHSPVDSATDAWDGWTPPGPRRHGFDFWYAYNCNGKHFDPNYWRDTPDRIDINKWSVTHETDVACDFIESVSENGPFALFMSWNPPHNPYIAPESNKSMYLDKDLPVRKNVIKDSLFERRYPSYLAAISSCDDNFGRLMALLDEKQFKENTIVVFSSDHGEMMGSHGRYAKSIWYEESIGIPFIIRWPNSIQPGQESMPFAVYDFMPTLLGLMGLDIPSSVEGTDFSRLILGQNQRKATSAVIASYGNPGNLMSIGQKPSIWALQADSLHRSGMDWRKVGYRGLRTERYTYVVDRGRKGEYLKRYLYDNKTDPFQLDPEINEGENRKTEIMRQLDFELQEWLNRMKDPFPL
jgi:arylsulfatase A-like enzyme